jgi:hypothetical protein
MITCIAKAHDLHAIIRNSLEHAADVLLQAYGYVHLYQQILFIKTHFMIAFAKFVKSSALESQVQLFAHDIANAFAMWQSSEVGRAEFEILRVGLDGPGRYFRKSYTQIIRRRLRMFLGSLHSSPVITLPMNLKSHAVISIVGWISRSHKFANSLEFCPTSVTLRPPLIRIKTRAIPF